MALHRFWQPLILGVLLLGSTAPGYADDEELCVPFRDSKVAPERVQAMLSAAEDGHLYRIQPSTSRMGFCIDSKLSRVKAEFRIFQGGLSLWPGPGEDELAMVVIRAASLDTDSSIIEDMLKSQRFFDVENYPEILFASKSLHWTSQTTGDLKGDLTLHGVTKAVTFHVQLTSMKKEPGSRVEKIVAKAGTTIRRSDFNMDSLSLLVYDSVELCMIVEAIRHDAQQNSS
ncbi:MAG: YceI family protein [Thiogranum sp.]